MNARPHELPSQVIPQGIVEIIQGFGARHRGVLQIVRFNWTQYASALISFAGGLVLLPALRDHLFLRSLALAGVGVAAYFSIASLIVSHWIYDRSILRGWGWIAGHLPQGIGKAANIHAGFDETSAPLRRTFPAAEIASWDIYQPALMTEASIARARVGCPTDCRARAANLEALPAADGAFDVVFLLFAAHEIRSARARECFFTEVCRTLEPGGAVLVVEHLRDLNNFLAFGPGFMHFLPEREWLRLAGRAGFDVSEQFTITPFVTVFRLTKPCAL